MVEARDRDRARIRARVRARVRDRIGVRIGLGLWFGLGFGSGLGFGFEQSGVPVGGDVDGHDEVGRGARGGEHARARGGLVERALVVLG